jgi:ribosomal protein S18 acetylase RimI-like enzyme
MITAVGWTGLLRLALAMQEMKKDHPRERYYYLQFIGVVPENQGKGAGKALMTPILGFVTVKSASIDKILLNSDGSKSIASSLPPVV